MIDHIFIKNYKAFVKENIPLEKHTLFIGTNNSGKTTVLEALDVFFNDNIQYQDIRNRHEDVVVEIHINEERYRKVFSPPRFNINYSKCIGNMYDINHIRYLYVPKHISNPKLMNDILSINYTKKIDPSEQTIIFKMFDYIDGTVGNSNCPLFQSNLRLEMDIKESLHFTSQEYSNMICNITYQYVIIGIDNVESNFKLSALEEITKYSYQTLLSTNDKTVITAFDYKVYALYKDDVKQEFETIHKQVVPHKTYLLVEGKYDVAWFETALKLLEKTQTHRVIPCGGAGNIQFVKEQLEKEHFKTIIITDGDTNKKTSLKKDIIELYADVEYVNQRFHTHFKAMPKSKHVFFKAISVKDDVVKNILSSWAKKHLTINHEFVQELKTLI